MCLQTIIHLVTQSLWQIKINLETNIQSQKTVSSGNWYCIENDAVYNNFLLLKEGLLNTARVLLSFQKKLHTLYVFERDILKKPGFEFIRKINQINLDDKCFLFYLAFIL